MIIKSVKSKTKLWLSMGCQYVRGKSCSAIYDLNNNQVFSLNKEATKIVDETLKEFALKDKASKACLSKLKELNLLTNCPPIKNAINSTVQPRLDYVWLELTAKCNCTCLHCYGSFGTPRTDNQIALTVKDWEKAIRTIQVLGCKSVQFIGGEPLLHPYIMHLLRYARQHDIENIDVFTNGTFLDKDTVGELSKVRASVRISLYGYDEASHDAITQKKGSFKALDIALKLLREAKIPTTIAVVIMRENQDSLDQIISYIESAGHRYTGYDTIRPVFGDGLSPHAVTNTEILRKRYMETPRFFTTKDRFAINKNWNSCWFGKFALTASGDIIPCIFARDDICGNIKRNSLHEIRDKLLSYWRITKDDVAECKSCEFRYACDDCRPLSEAICGDLYAKYPRCCYDPLRGEWQTLASTPIGNPELITLEAETQ